jgi:hypothetical protein
MDAQKGFECLLDGEELAVRRPDTALTLIPHKFSGQSKTHLAQAGRRTAVHRRLASPKSQV